MAFQLKDVTLQALKDCRIGMPHNVASIEIHSDGATSDGPAGWANILITYDSTGQKWFSGYRVGLVVTDPMHSENIGADRPTAACAELSGIAWALKHAPQYAGTLGPVTIFYDCMYASDTAQALCVAKANGIIAKITSGLALLLAQFGALHWIHEKGHHELPWNEFADVAAKWACKQTFAYTVMATPCAQWLSAGNSYANWAFLLRPTDK